MTRHPHLFALVSAPPALCVTWGGQMPELGLGVRYPHPKVMVSYTGRGAVDRLVASFDTYRRTPVSHSVLGVIVMTPRGECGSRRATHRGGPEGPGCSALCSETTRPCMAVPRAPPSPKPAPRCALARGGIRDLDQDRSSNAYRERGNAKLRPGAPSTARGPSRAALTPADFAAGGRGLMSVRTLASWGEALGPRAHVAGNRRAVS